MSHNIQFFSLNYRFQIKRKERERAEKADSRERGGNSDEREKGATSEMSS